MANSAPDAERIEQILWDLTDGDIGNRETVGHLAQQLVSRGVRMERATQREALTELLWQAEADPDLGFRYNCEAMAVWLIDHGVTVPVDG